MPGLIKRSFSHLDNNMFLNLYKCLVKPHLEYGSAACATKFKREIAKIENIQRRATKLLPKLKTYYTVTLGLPTLEYRRRITDII